MQGTAGLAAPCTQQSRSSISCTQAPCCRSRSSTPLMMRAGGAAVFLLLTSAAASEEWLVQEWQSWSGPEPPEHRITIAGAHVLDADSSLISYGVSWQHVASMFIKTVAARGGIHVGGVPYGMRRPPAARRTRPPPVLERARQLQRHEPSRRRTRSRRTTAARRSSSRPRATRAQACASSAWNKAARTRS